MAQSTVRVNPQFKTLRWRLLLSSLSVIGGTLALFSTVVYHVVSFNLEQKADRELALLADAAAHSLPEMLIQGTATSSTPIGTLDNDGDLDIPWQDLKQPQQAVEWFDADGTLVGRSGDSSTTDVLEPLSLADRVSPREGQNDMDYPETNSEGVIDGRIHWLVLPVYSGTHESSELQGYVRVSVSNDAIAAELERLRQGLQWGGLFAVTLSGLGGWWLVRQSLQPIERSMYQLRQFTADASHELRNPLTAIKTSVEVMQSHPERFNPLDAQKLEAIASATNQMSRLVNDLLWLARSDRLGFDSTAYVILPIDELLEELVDQYLPQYEQKSIEFRIDLRANTRVKGDPYQLKRLIGNLLVNALYYTPTGGSVTLRSWAEGDWITIRVQDTGIGISQEQVPFIFDRFWRSEQARAYQEGGTGLGLAIAQAIVHQHGGSITVRSEVDKGSSFQVTLPAY